MTRTIGSTTHLNNGIEIPWLGLGVYQSSPGEETQRAVQWALETGYRHIDTARAYGNERDVGAAIRDSGVPREEVFVTTKLWNEDHGYERASRAVDGSLERLGSASARTPACSTSGSRMRMWPSSMRWMRTSRPDGIRQTHLRL